MAHTVADIQTRPAPSVKRLLRQAGYTLADVARRRACDPSAVSRTIRKQATSAGIWAAVVWCLNHPKENGR